MFYFSEFSTYLLLEHKTKSLENDFKYTPKNLAQIFLVAAHSHVI